MKQYVILTVVIITLVIFSSWQINFLNKSQEKINNVVGKIEEALKKEDYMLASQRYNDLYQEWENMHSGVDAFSDHLDVETFEKAMASLNVYISEQEKAVALEQCSILVQVIEHIVESEKLSVASVF